MMKKAFKTVVLILAVVLAGAALIILRYGLEFSPDAAARARLRSGSMELIYSQALGNEFEARIYSSDDTFSAVLTQKKGPFWTAVSASTAVWGDRVIDFLSCAAWMDGNREMTFVALRCADEKVAYIILGEHTIPVENELATLNVEGRLVLRGLSGEALAENGEKRYTMVTRREPDIEYATPFWEAQ